MELFELGFIKIAGVRTIACEEISVSASQENQTRHVCDQIFPVDLHPVKKKVEFTLKKPKLLDNDLLFYLYTHYYPFDIYLYQILDDDETGALTPKLYMVLKNCLIDNVNFGNFDGTKPVTEEIKGSTLYYIFSSSMSAAKDSIRKTNKQDLPNLVSELDQLRSTTTDVGTGSKKKNT